MSDLSDTIKAMGETAHDKTTRAKANYDRVLGNASAASCREEYSKAAHLRDVAAGYLNDHFFWNGQASMARVIVYGMEFQEIVEEELGAEGSCP